MLKAIIKKTKETINITRHHADSNNFNKIYYFDDNNNPYGEDELIFIDSEENAIPNFNANQLPEGFKLIEVNADSAEEVINAINKSIGRQQSDKDKYEVGLSMVNMVLNTFNTILNNSDTHTVDSKGEINDPLLAKVLQTACEIVDAAAEILGKTEDKE